MKKVTKLFIGLIIAVMFVACGEEKTSSDKPVQLDGPINARMINGEKRIYAGDKPATGPINSTITLDDGTTVEILEVYVEDGVMYAGNFNIYDYDGVLKVEGVGSLLSGDMWVGTIKTFHDKGNPFEVYSGTFDRGLIQEAAQDSFHADYVGTLYFKTYHVLRDGEITIYNSDGSLYEKYSVEDGRRK